MQRFRMAGVKTVVIVEHRRLGTSNIGTQKSPPKVSPVRAMAMSSNLQSAPH
jgi:hypothetical protein